MNSFLKLVIPVLFVFASSLAVSDESFVMRSPATVVTATDIDRYILENIPADETQRALLLAKPGFFKEMAESLLIIRTLAKEAEGTLSIDEEQSRWSAELAYQRKLVSNYRVAYVRDVFKKVDWDSTAKEAYNAQSGLYVSRGSVAVSHILIRTKERSEEEALKLISPLLTRANKGEDFAALAKEFSEDESAGRNSGNLGNIQRGQMLPEFEQAAFALMTPGDVSEPVKTKFGYHIIKLHSKRAGGPIPFEEAKPQIIDELQVQMGDQIWQDKIIATRSNPDLVRNDELLEALRQKYKIVPKKES